jgi:hypothetical protein
MTIFKTFVDVVDGDQVQSAVLDTISWRGQLWLVPKWQSGKTEGTRLPVRIVRPRLFAFEQPSHPQHEEDYSLVCAIPKAILDGQPALGGVVEFESVEAPNIEYPIPKPG